MSFDLSNVINAATQEHHDAQKRDEERGNYNDVPLIYPDEGIIWVKLQYCPASNMVQRKIGRHKIEGSQETCLELYGQECHIDKAINDVKNAKGVDLWDKYASKWRGICHAQFIKFDYKGWSADDTPAERSQVLLMYPMMVYKEINRIISEAGAKANLLVASNKGCVIKIIKNSQSNPVYKVEVDPWNMEYESIPTKDSNGVDIRTVDEAESEYEALLNSLQDLRDKFCPKEVTQEVLAKNKAAAESILKEYLSNSVENYSGPNSSPSDNGQSLADMATSNTTQNNEVNHSINQDQQSSTSSTESTVSSTNTNSQSGSEYPGCFKKYGTEPANKCLVCPHEIVCQSNTPK